MQSGNEVYHYGIPGMRWGHRKGSAKTSNSRKTIERSEDYKKVRAINKKHISELSNQELEMLNRRLQLEKQYKDLTPMQVSKGKLTVDRVLKSAKTVNEIYKLINSPLAKDIRKAAARI